ncbi:MAG: hypothetical protein HDS66_00335 [Bacteroidales bacterium]|nr:hypothetical protein [Bacteroidales bacterium]
MILVWILLIAWGLWLLAPRIGKWAMRRMQRKMQDQMFRSMGLNPDDFREKTYSDKKQSDKARSEQRRRASKRASRKIIPEGYGEYVQFTVLTLTGTEPWLDTSASPIYVHYKETQVTDIRWHEIK